MRRALLGLLGSLVAGCLYVPYPFGPVAGSRRPPASASLDLLKSAPTREEVLLELGEPDWVGDGQRLFVYTWKEYRGGLIAVGGSHGAISGRRHAFLVEFDARSLVIHADVKHSFANDVSEFISGW